jgi:hypothetical protein
MYALRETAFMVRVERGQTQIEQDPEMDSSGKASLKSK